MKVRIAAMVVALLAGACGSTVRQAARTTSAGDAEFGSPAASADASSGGDVNDETVAAGSGTTTPRSDRKASANVAAAGAAVTTPIELGFVRTGVSNAAAFGASLGNSISETDIDNGLVAAFNDHGGIAGRRIVPVYADTDTGSTSWDTDFAAACASFTQDHKVAAVLGYVFTHLDSFEGCLASKRIPHLSTTFNVPDAPTLRQYPLLLALSTPLIERRSIAKIDGALATGAATRNSKLGVVIDDCPSTTAAWAKTIRPYLAAKSLTVAATFEVGCAHGAGDAGAEAARAGSLVLQFRSAGVDTVLFMTVSEGPALLIFSGGAEAQGYHPRYIVSSLANAAVLQNQIPARQAANVDGYGWLPVQDVKPQYWPGLTAPAKRCLDMLKTKNIIPSAPADFAFAFSACEALFAYETALKATHGRSDGAAIVAAIEALGATGYTSVMNLGGRATFSHTRHDAPGDARHFAWTAGCTCFTYRSTNVAMP